MKLCIGMLLCVGLAACEPDRSPQTAYDSSPRAIPPMPYDDVPPPPSEPRLTPASGTGAPRAVASEAATSAEPAATSSEPSAMSSGIDQGENPNDLQITHEIRKSIVANPTLSFTAKNVTIVTRHGRVTLRGQVNTKRERASIEQAARKIGAVKLVDNELVVLE